MHIRIYVYVYIYIHIYIYTFVFIGNMNPIQSSNNDKYENNQNNYSNNDNYNTNNSKYNDNNNSKIKETLKNKIHDDEIDLDDEIEAERNGRCVSIHICIHKTFLISV
jgi:hypothetical protein